MSAETTILNELLDPVGNCLTLESAKQLVELRAPATVQARIEELADKSDTGKLLKKNGST